MSVGYKVGCREKTREHWSKNPLQLPSVPEKGAGCAMGLEIGDAEEAEAATSNGGGGVSIACWSRLTSSRIGSVSLILLVWSDLLQSIGSSAEIAPKVDPDTVKSGPTPKPRC